MVVRSLIGRIDFGASAGDIPPKPITGQLLNWAPGQAVGAGEHGQDRPEARAERPGRDARNRDTSAGGGGIR